MGVDIFNSSKVHISLAMANKLYLLCFIILCLSEQLVYCKRFGKSGRGSTSSKHSGGSSHSRHIGRPSTSRSNSWKHKYPASKSGLSGSSWHPPALSGKSSSSNGIGGSVNYPASVGLSGSTLWGSGLSNSHDYPSSQGLSGKSSSRTGSGGAPQYPVSSGLSGQSTLGSSGSNLYPPTSGLSGQTSSILQSSGYPISHGLSGKSSFGSGFGGSKDYQPTSQQGTSKSHGYPVSSRPTLSGSHASFGPSITIKPPSNPPLHTSHNYNNNYNLNNKYENSQSSFGRPNYQGWNGHPHLVGAQYHPSSFSSAPQYVYVNEYRNSGSRFNNLLAGLTLYNLVRSSNNHHDHYYYDDYYHRRQYGSHNAYRTERKPKEVAQCVLKIKENNDYQLLKIPCEIVSTFTEGSNNITKQKDFNTTVCATNLTIINSSTASPENITLKNNETANVNVLLSVESTTFSYLSQNSSKLLTDLTSINSSTANPGNLTLKNNYTANIIMLPSVESTTLSYLSQNSSKLLADALNVSLSDVTNISMTNASYGLTSNNTESQDGLNNVTITNSLFVTPSTNFNNVTNLNSNYSFPTDFKMQNSNLSNGTGINERPCVSTQAIDPLTVSGKSVNTTNMECEVEIRTQQSLLHQKIDCNTLLEYSKLQEPKKDTNILPPKSTLQSWVSNPPWWLSTFISV